MATYERHPTTGNLVGRWHKSVGFRYWEGPCSCGSGKPGHEEYDDNGIFFCISCSSCKRKAASGPYDEPIDEE